MYYSWLKFQRNFLTWLLNGKIEKITVYLLFSLYIQFSAIEIRLGFSQAKFMICWLQWLEKRLGSHARWWATASFQLTELKIKVNPSCLQCARVIVVITFIIIIIIIIIIFSIFSTLFLIVVQNFSFEIAYNQYILWRTLLIYRFRPA